MHVRKDGRRICVEVDLPVAVTDVRFEFRSSRNASLVRHSDESPHRPETEQPRSVGPTEIWYPVVDLEIEPVMEASITFAGPPSSYVVNGALLNQAMPLVDTTTVATVEAAHLVHWENTVYVSDSRVAVTDFAIVKLVHVLPTITRRVSCIVRSLSADWHGEACALIRVDGRTETIGSVVVGDVEPDAETAATAEDDARAIHDLSDKDLERVASEAVRHLMNSVNDCPTSPTRGGFYLFYDLDARTYRNPYWVWGWGPCIRFLLDASTRPELCGDSTVSDVAAAAVEAGDTSLRFQIHNPWHITDGLATTRWSPKPHEPNGIVELVNSGSDAGFLVGWAWLALHDHTGDHRYLDAARRYAEATERLVRRFGLIPQEYLPATNEFTDFTIDESGFGTEGLAAIFEATGEQAYATLCAEYMDHHLLALERDDGLWERRWDHNRRAVDATEFMTRGLGWAMEGLLAADRATDDDRYLMKAQKMADQMIRMQLPDGSWSCRCNRPVSEVGVDEKGVALWALLLYLLYGRTSLPDHLEAARRALMWCIRHQYQGPDAHARGGVPGVSPTSGVIYRPWFRLSCTYTVGFFGLALLEELKQRRPETGGLE